MSDVNTFIDTIGKDISETVSPKIQTLAEQITAQTFSQYGPRVSAFAGELVKDVIEEQSSAIRDFVTGLIQDIFQRYRPELTGALRAAGAVTYVHSLAGPADIQRFWDLGVGVYSDEPFPPLGAATPAVRAPAFDPATALPPA